ncbi:hypothetical protein PM082_007507 [Marasmius tenuissimus]|nr:hypothetical protein PM082_007507 [Marasmius tenuissimus]
MREIENRSTVEPNRWNLRAWFILRWREMKDVSESYLTLMALKKEIVTVVESQRRHLLASVSQSNSDITTASVVVA